MSDATPRPQDLAVRLLAEADRCVKCGLCLPACPTYRLEVLEGESPRGRIALIQGLLAGELPPSQGVESHLDNCLGCRACEAACPSGVRYGELIDGVRSRLDRPRRASRRALLGALVEPAWSGAALRLARALRLHRLAGALPARAGRWLRLSAPGEGGAAARRALAPRRAAQDLPSLPRVGLFLGCVAREADAPVHAAARAILEALGHEVAVPEGQGCCGAMHRHAGLLEEAAGLAINHARVWNASGATVVVSTATGCGASLREHPSWGGDQALSAPPAVDLLSFLARADWSRLPLGPLPDRVALHLPCSARYAGLSETDVLGLLARVPGLETVALDSRLACCGAAGTYLLHHGSKADALREPTLDAIVASGADAVLTTNTGCAMHLRAGLAARGLALPVAHPVELLARAAFGTAALDSQ